VSETIARKKVRAERAQEQRRGNSRPQAEGAQHTRGSRVREQRHACVWKKGAHRLAATKEYQRMIQGSVQADVAGEESKTLVSARTQNINICKDNQRGRGGSSRICWSPLIHIQRQSAHITKHQMRWGCKRNQIHIGVWWGDLAILAIEDHDAPRELCDVLPLQPRETCARSQQRRFSEEG
jgi:hypothetical protein